MPDSTVPDVSGLDITPITKTSRTIDLPTVTVERMLQVPAGYRIAQVEILRWAGPRSYSGIRFTLERF